MDVMARPYTPRYGSSDESTDEIPEVTVTLKSTRSINSEKVHQDEVARLKQLITAQRNAILMAKQALTAAGSISAAADLDDVLAQSLPSLAQDLSIDDGSAPSPTTPGSSVRQDDAYFSSRTSAHGASTSALVDDVLAASMDGHASAETASNPLSSQVEESPITCDIWEEMDGKPKAGYTTAQCVGSI